ncbi:MAG: cell division protein ZapA [Pseudomonadota bacterium]
MSTVEVIINGRDYRLACEDGQEDHLRTLAAKLDDKVNAIKGNFGEIGDNRLTVMAALMVTDELEEIKRGQGKVESELQTMRKRMGDADGKFSEAEEIITEVLTAAAERIERLTASLGAGPA